VKPTYIMLLRKNAYCVGLPLEVNNTDQPNLVSVTPDIRIVQSTKPTR